MKKKERELALCQMQVIETIMQDSLTVSQAIRQLGLNKAKYMELAESEGLEFIATKIEKELLKDF